MFVGRRDVLARLLRGLADGEQVRVDEVSGALGMGKSALMREVRRRSRETGATVLTAYVDLTTYDPGASGRSGQEPTWGLSRKSHDQLLRLAREIVGAVAPESVSRIEQAAAAGLRRVTEVKAVVNVYAGLTAESGATVSGSPQNLAINVASPQAIDGAVVGAMHDAQVMLTDALVACLNETARTRPVVLLLDNADTVVAQDLGYWLRRVVTALDGVVTVLTHEPDARPELSPGLGTCVRLEPFSHDEVRDFVAARVDEEPDPELVTLLHEWTGGVPVALQILVDLMNDRDIPLSRSDLENRLSRLPADAEGRLARVVTEMVERLEGRRLGTALRAASIPVECDVELLTRLLADDDVTPDDAADLMRNLEVFSFTDEYWSDGVYYTKVHQFIRAGLADYMRRYQPSEQKRLHAVAAAFFYEQLTGSDAYGDMYALEKPTQQGVLRKWLYHAAHSGDRRSTALQAAKVFFDAFWWWGSYVHFDYCETLAADFDSLALTLDVDRLVQDDDRTLTRFAAAVRRFIGSYPYRATLRRDFDRAYPPARWDEVDAALLSIRQLCGLPTTPRHDASDLERQVAALLAVFEAHVARFGSPPDRAWSDGRYEEALQWFTLTDRRWDVPWVEFERGDLALEDDDVVRARELGSSAAASLHEVLDKDAPDEELIADLHRLRADCAWADGDHDGAARDYALAVVHAYLFHQVGGPPDDYTMQFYYEVRGRAIERLLHLWHSGERARALRFGRGLQEPFARARALPASSDEELTTICESGTLYELALALFPRGPEIAELGPGVTSSAFMDTVLRVKRRLADIVSGDLDEHAAR